MTRKILPIYITLLQPMRRKEQKSTANVECLGCMPLQYQNPIADGSLCMLQTIGQSVRKEYFRFFLNVSD